MHTWKEGNRIAPRTRTQSSPRQQRAKGKFFQGQRSVGVIAWHRPLAADPRGLLPLQRTAVYDTFHQLFNFLTCHANLSPKALSLFLYSEEILPSKSGFSFTCITTAIFEKQRQISRQTGVFLTYSNAESRVGKDRRKSLKLSRFSELLLLPVPLLLPTGKSFQFNFWKI